MGNEQNNMEDQQNFVKKEFENFSRFLSKYSIFALAVGTILGQTSKDVVNKLVTGIISPAIALIMPRGEFNNWQVNVKDSTFLLGQFFDSLIQMVVTMVVIYFVAKYIFRNTDVLDSKKKVTLKKAKPEEKTPAQK